MLAGLAVILLLIPIISAACPKGCTCSGKLVDCAKIEKFEDIPSDTETLILTNNGLDELQEAVFARLKSLRALNLSYNQLEELPRNLPDLDLLQTLDMSHNDIVCDCDLLRLMKRFSDRVYIKGPFCWLAGIKYEISNLTCAHLPDECGTNLGKCHRNAFCDIDKDEDTSICTCKEGFQGNGISCEDKDECKSKNECHKNAHCTNTIGSYTCKCFAFYKGNGTYCQDIDHCAKKDRCQEDEVCENVDGGFNCRCRLGFTKASDEPKSRCRDLNECTETKTCNELVTCENTYGSYKCGSCPRRYVGDGHYCNVACNFTSCGTNSKCFDILSGPLCRCPFGMYNHSNNCVPGNFIMKIGKLRIEKYFTQGLHRRDSPAFLEVARLIEPAVLDFLKSSFPYVANVHAVKMVPGEFYTDTFVDLAILVKGNKGSHHGTESFTGGIKRADNRVNATKVKRVLDEWIDATVDAYGINVLKHSDLHVGMTNLCVLGLHGCTSHALCIPLSTLDYKCECEKGYIMRNEQCVKNRLVMKIIVVIVVVGALLAIGAGIVYARKKYSKREEEDKISAKSTFERDVSFHNPAYEENVNVSSSSL